MQGTELISFLCEVNICPIHSNAQYFILDQSPRGHDEFSSICLTSSAPACRIKLSENPSELG